VLRRRGQRRRTSRPLVILLRSADWPSRYQAATLALTAAALGDPVHLALFFEALAAWVEGRFDEGAPAQAAGARVGSLRASLEEGRQELGLEVVACDTAVRLAGLDPARAAAALDRVLGLPELWRIARAGQAVAI
jgi:peroxiredoxin family protein